MIADSVKPLIIIIAPLWKSGAILDLPCPSGILWFCHNSDETWISLRPVGQCWSNFIWSIIRVGERLHKGLGQIGLKLWFPWKRPLTFNGENDVSTFSRLFLIRFFLYLQVTRTCIKSRTSLTFGQIGPLTMELAALERLKISHRLIMGQWCLQASSFIFDRIFVKLAGNQDSHKISYEFEFWLDRMSHFGVMCPCGGIKFSIDILWCLHLFSGGAR